MARGKGGSGEKGRGRERSVRRSEAMDKEGEPVLCRWVVIFVPASSLISPLLLRHGADAATPSRGAVAGWCAVVLVRMHISVPHILIQGVITRLSSAHSHHRLNHPPPPPLFLHPLILIHLLHLRLFLLLHHQSSCGSPSPTQPPTYPYSTTFTTRNWKNLLADRFFPLSFSLIYT